MSELSPEVRERAAKIELLVLDVDGVFTDGRLWYGPEGEALKAMDVRDGHGLVMLRECGLKLAVLSGRPQPLLKRRFEELRFTKVVERCIRKTEAIAEMAGELGLELTQVAFIGDDLNDRGALESVGLSCAPADAAPEIRALVHHVCAASGGRGAVREVCEVILKARGQWPPW
ncbi:MAG: HAD hydrolase family protein [Deltaproteobacteria bacterium]|nr:HAD hydrolase family protein [Deltaproteobacteria bacterium]